MMARLRQATPADAKRVWDSMLAADVNPTVRGVATALTAAGMDANYRTVHRWQANGFDEPPSSSRSSSRSRSGRAAGKLEAAVPVLTGKAETRVRDLVKTYDDPSLDNFANEEMVENAARSVCKSIIILSRLVQDNAVLALTMPREIGALQAALAGSLAAANVSFEAVTRARIGTAKVISHRQTEHEHDPLAKAMIAYERAEKAQIG
jgi:hypothetical protein